MYKSPEQQSQDDKEKNRCELKIVVVKNGWVVKEGNNDWYVFTQFDGVVEHIKRYFGYGQVTR